MRRSGMILLSVLIFSITIALVMNLPFVQAFHKEGPAPIPGNLIPHPVPPNDNHAKNHGIAEPGNNR